MHRVTVKSTRIIAYVPQSALARPLIPVTLLLHGSARDAEQLMQAHLPIADRDGVVVIAPYATSGTWDAINTTFGPDIEGIDRALSWLFDRLPVNPSRVAITGFSDGATYTLALGRANGDLFSRVVAYSPGFLIDVKPIGQPQIFISHGTHDEELPYEKTRDQIVPTLQHSGYSVEFHTFEGPHTILLGLVEETLAALAN
jgi:phospholipase/carboxylesterase